MSLFEESCRVPLVIVAPGACPGRGRGAAAPVSQVDIYPDARPALCGLDAPASNLQGQSLAPLLADLGRNGPRLGPHAGDPRRPAAAQHPRHR